MEDIKKFFKTYKKEIIVVTAGVMIYNLGFKKGFESAKEGMRYLIEESAKALEVAHV